MKNFTFAPTVSLALRAALLLAAALQAACNEGSDLSAMAQSAGAASAASALPSSAVEPLKALANRPDDYALFVAGVTEIRH